MFGPHLVLELYGCDEQATRSVEITADILDKLPDEIGMTKIMPPYVFKYKGKVEEEWGVSGVVLIAESHIAVHTFPDQNGFIAVDIFSCKDFDVELATATIEKYYKPTKTDSKFFMRGREYPRSIGKAGAILETERRSIDV